MKSLCLKVFFIQFLNNLSSLVLALSTAFSWSFLALFLLILSLISSSSGCLDYLPSTGDFFGDSLGAL